MKNTKKIVSIVLAVIMLVTAIPMSLTAYASTGVLCSKYATNPDSKVGVQKTITIDGNASDWSEDMLIAQGAAWDIANNYKGGHENCVLDTYALFAAWDNSNLYIGWQMVNTTDTWAREGDGPLSDGGRVLDVPLILALSVDPTSTSMSNKNTDGNPIWGQKMGVSFEQHVDRLLYMSGKPGLGEPGLFTAVDSKGNTNYSTGLKGFAKAGIEYKMAETNICSHIYGLDGSKSTKDIYDDNAKWVDYKTFKGSSGTHNIKYDSFYEIKIPYSALGIDKNYLEQYGIGAMLIATRGESGLDCIPYDDTMLDNATGSYGSDPSTSHEKDDEDVITSEFARIGNMGGKTPDVKPTQPATQPVTQPATQPTTPSGTTGKLTVNAKSNIFSTASTSVDYSSANANTVTVTYNLQSTMPLVNAEWNLKYDTSKLRLKTSASSLTPHMNSTTNIYNNVVYGNFSQVSNLVDFTSSKPFLRAEFEVLGQGSADVTLTVKELSVGYLSGGNLTYKNAIANGTVQNLTSVPGFSGFSFTANASVTSGSDGYLMGDVNLDGKITVVDATTIQRYLAQLETLSDTQKALADVDKSGNITVVDATTIQRYIAGLISSF